MPSFSRSRAFAAKLERDIYHGIAAGTVIRACSGSFHYASNRNCVAGKRRIEPKKLRTEV